MNIVDYHSKRAMQEFHAGMVAKNREASEAHLRLSSLHMAQVNMPGALPEPASAQGQRRTA